MVGIYSAQCSYRWSARDELIVGLAYVNIEVSDKYGFGLYPGDKPENVREAVKDARPSMRRTPRWESDSDD